ncbi:hypothetical protein Bbelb_240360 [Branchiostoma belcheri]|nr:hypothetical protein Bbelb_240360 [Branchiostoma belcheri]
MTYMTVSCQGDSLKLQNDLDTLAEWGEKWAMEFHPDKCEVLSITRKRAPIVYDYSLHGHILKHVSFVKYLGVLISGDLRWDLHIDHVSSKANNTVNFLRRNINIANPQVKARAYKTLVRPILEYCQTVWDPYTQSNIRNLEAVQRRAARFALRRYRRQSSVANMLVTLDWPLLVERRRNARLQMFYKITNNIVAMHMPLASKGLRAPSRTENSLALHPPSSRADYHLNSFFSKTVREWNRLPDSVVKAKSLQAFKNAIHTL